MARIEEVRCFTIGYKNTHDSWVAPIVALGVLHVPYVLNRESESIETYHGHQDPPRVPDECPPENADEGHHVHHKTADDQQCISLGNIFQKILIDSCRFNKNFVTYAHLRNFRIFLFFLE